MTALDNPIWHALTTDQRALAEGAGPVRRYPPLVAPLGAMAEPSADAWTALAELLGPQGKAGLFLDHPADPPPGWTLFLRDAAAQMVYERSSPPTVTAAAAPVTLGPADVPEMIDLATRTEPGPFMPRTIELGTYLGIRQDGRLAAMAGVRLHLAPYHEVSAVCTDPAYRGRGYAATLVAAIVGQIRARDETPILHVRADNHAAIRVYERLGFATRRVLHVTGVQAP